MITLFFLEKESMTFRLSKNNNGFIGASELFEKKIDKMTSLYGRYGHGSFRVPTSEIIFFVLCLEFHCGHLSPLLLNNSQK